MNIIRNSLTITALLTALSNPGIAAGGSAPMLLASIDSISDSNVVRAKRNPAIAAWMWKQLMVPGKGQVTAEQRGRIQIYDGMTDVQVEQAMDKHFDRIESMMFVRTVVTDASGLAKVDAETGKEEVEDDDCD